MSDLDSLNSTSPENRLEQIGSAAAGIAHDINNRLHVLVNCLEVRDLGAAREAARQCSALTSSLLSFCRGESLAVGPVNLEEYLREYQCGLALPAGITLTLEVGPDVGDVRADRGAVTRILNNLVHNACDAMGNRGGIRLRASGREIQVVDSGPGIPAEQLRKVFDAFYTTKGQAGTGLGLAIVRDLMRQQGGSVTVASRVGEGACFTLRFRA